MTRVFHSEKLSVNTSIELDEFASMHLSRALRKKTGDHISVFNPAGEFLAVIQTVTKRAITVLILKQIIVHTESGLHTTLLQAITRRERMDYSIQKATELGVSKIQPFLSEHCVVKLNSKKMAQKINHWQGIARHAAEQSGRLCIPSIEPIDSFTQCVQKSDTASNRLIFAVQSAHNLSAIPFEPSKKLTLALGPVGGFSESEVQAANNYGFTSIKLGPRILRAETATVASLTAIQLRWGDLDKSVTRN